MIELVITVALKAELPPSISTGIIVPILTVKDLKKSDSPPSSFILITGVGLDHSTRAIDALSPFTVRHILNIGTAGALNDPSKQGQTYSIHTISKEETRRPLLHTLDKQLNLNTASLLSSPQPVSTKSLEADLVDMEAFAQAQYCLERNIPFSCIKTVSDYVETSSLEQFKRNLPNVHQQFLSVLEKIISQETPEISVIIPVYNRPDFITRAIESALNQSVKPKEILVIDDGSTDETVDTCQKFNDQITLLTHSKNKGVSAARNTGIQNASGNWISFLDSDDEWHEHKLKDQLAFLNNNPGYKVIHSNEKWIRNGQQITQKKHQKKCSGWQFKQSLDRCTIAASNVLIHRSLFDSIGTFNTELPACEDYDLWCRLSRHYPIGLVENIGHTRYAGHPDQLSSRTKALDQYRIYSLKQLLKQESSETHQSLIKEALVKKEKIMDTGAKKRKEKGDSWISKSWTPKT